MKKILSVILSLAVIFSAFGTLLITSAEAAGLDIVYAQAGGEGDGSSAEAPTTLENAMNIVNDGGTVFVIGEVGDATVGANVIGVADKAMHIRGVNEESGIVSLYRFHLKGKLTLSRLTFRVVEPNTDKSAFTFFCEDGSADDITFGEEIYLPTWTGGLNYFPFLQGGISNKLTINSGKFNHYILAGGYNNSQTSSNDIVINGGEVSGIAIARGWASSGSPSFSGTYKFTVNGGKVDNLMLGHLQANARQLSGAYTAVINGGEVGTVYVGPQNTELNGSGVRIVEINGGTISTVKGRGGTAGNANQKAVVIFNNGMADKVGTINTANINTIIKANTGAQVSAVVSGSSLQGYKITVDEGKYPLIDGVSVTPNASGLYTIADGTHEVTVADAVDTVYASADGTGAGTSAEDATTMDKAVAMVKDGGTVYVVGEIGTDSGKYVIGASGKTINFLGADETSAFKAGTCFELAGAITFDNLTFKTATEYDFLFNTENSSSNDITIGENVTLPAYTSNSKGYIVFGKSESVNKLTLNTGSYTNIYAAHLNNSVYSMASQVILNEGASAKGLYIGHGWYNTSNSSFKRFDGNFKFYINGGSAETIVLGQGQAQPAELDGAFSAIVNSGTVGTIKLGGNSSQVNSSGYRIAEINGGTIDSVIDGVSTGAKKIVIFNNDMYGQVANFTATADTLVKASAGGIVTAKTSGNSLLGYEITTTADKVVLLDGEVVLSGVETGMIQIAEGEHTITFGDVAEYPETYETIVRRNTWVERAEAMINDTEKTFIGGYNAFYAALFNLKTAADDADTTELIAALKSAWNSLAYTVGTPAEGEEAEVIVAKLYGYGDVNSDGAVDLLDFVRSKKSLAGDEVEMAEYAFDMNDDNAYDGLDISELAKAIL